MDGATQAAHNGRVTFNVSTTATDRPFVGLRCWQGTNFVYDGYVGYFPGAMFDPWFTLDSARLGRRSLGQLHRQALLLRPTRQPERADARMSFPVAP